MQLYNMKKDPGEKTNLIEKGRYGRKVERLRKKMRRYVDSGRSPPGNAVPVKSSEWKATELF